MNAPEPKRVAGPGADLDSASGRELDLSPEQFAVLNTRVLGVAYRIVGSWADAEEIASRTWMRWHTSRPDTVREPAAWLTTVATRISLDLWRTAVRRREDYIGPWLPEPVDEARLPDESVEQRETLSLALMHLMERLTPYERAVYVLRNAFDFSYPEIAEMVGRAPAACRQLGHRAQQKIGDLPARLSDGDQRSALDRLVSAVLQGRVEDAVALISADAVLLTDGGGRTRAALNPVLGAERVVRFLVGVVEKTRRSVPDDAVSLDMIDVNGAPACRFTTGGVVRVFTLQLDEQGAISTVFGLSNPEKLTGLQTA